MEDTLAFNSTDERGTQGWISRYSFIPEMMTGMNSTFYSFKGGELFVHNSHNVPRNYFYETLYPSTVTTLLNDDPSVTKMFKTIAIDSDHKWDVEVKTDLDSGFIDKSQLVEKEGNYYSYIHKEDGFTLTEEDIKHLSTQGIGSLLSVAGNVLTFSFNIGTAISIGDRLYRMGTSMELLGTVVAKTDTTITVDALLVAINPSDFILYGKNKLAESYGVRGYYMEAKLTNNDTDSVEIFAVTSSVFKSFQ